MLCTRVLGSLASTLDVMSVEPGRDFAIVTVSIDPRDKASKAAELKDKYVRRYGRLNAATGWHFLTGHDSAIRKLTDTVGFQYAYEPVSDQFAHAAVLLVLTPDGRTSRYFYGFEHKPRDLRLAIVEASGNKIGSLTDQFLLLCFHYDPATGKYGGAALTAVRVGGVLTIAAFLSFLFVSLRRERAAGPGPTVHRT